MYLKDADVIIVNTCYVKHPTEQKVLNRIQGVQREFPDKKLIISGCMVEIDPEKLNKAAPSAGWIGPRQIKSTVDVVESCLDDEFIRINGHGTDIKAGLPKYVLIRRYIYCKYVKDVKVSALTVAPDLQEVHYRVIRLISLKKK